MRFTFGMALLVAMLASSQTVLAHHPGEDLDRCLFRPLAEPPLLGYGAAVSCFDPLPSAGPETAR